MLMKSHAIHGIYNIFLCNPSPTLFTRIFSNSKYANPLTHSLHMAIDCVFYTATFLLPIMPWILCWHVFEHMNNFFSSYFLPRTHRLCFTMNFFVCLKNETKPLFCLPFECRWFGLAVVIKKMRDKFFFESITLMKATEIEWMMA